MTAGAAELPFGRWPSPLSIDAVAAGKLSRSGLRSDGRCLYWVESRPEEGGRQVVMSQVVVHGEPKEPAVRVSPSSANVRSRVHEYGGGAYCLVVARAGGRPKLAYVELKDQRVWLHDPGSGSSPHPISPDRVAGERRAHGDLSATPDGSWVLAVRETLHDGGATRAVVAYGLDGERPATVLLEGPGFFAAPRVDGSARRLAWVTWSHPDMPWDASELWVGNLARDSRTLRVDGARLVAGGAGLSVGQPAWCSTGDLLFMADEGGWWRPHAWGDASGIRVLSDEEAEFHRPDWVLGQSTVAELPGGRQLCRRRRGVDGLVVLDTETGAAHALEQPCVSIESVCKHGSGAAWLGATAYAPASIWTWAGDSRSPAAVVAGPELLAAGSVSLAEHFACPNADGETVHGLFYGPCGEGLRGPRGERPPLVVACHGGPTASSEAGFDPLVQLLTTRGYAVAAVDYGGSSGYGRDYRQRLRGRWGLLDPDDCAAAAMHLAAEGRVDGARMAIRGASAGGFTALCAMARADIFRAAVSWYGVTDLVALAASTHDFESRYLDSLVGKLPEAIDEYGRRSPVALAERIEGAVLVLQGLEDPVVPADQASAMVDVLRRRGRRCEYLVFEGESHGFRGFETLRDALGAELAFYQEVLLSAGW